MKRATKSPAIKPAPKPVKQGPPSRESLQDAKNKEFLKSFASKLATGSFFKVRVDNFDMYSNNMVRLKVGDVFRLRDGEETHEWVVEHVDFDGHVARASWVKDSYYKMTLNSAVEQGFVKKHIHDFQPADVVRTAVETTNIGRKESSQQMKKSEESSSEEGGRQSSRGMALFIKDLVLKKEKRDVILAKTLKKWPSSNRSNPAWIEPMIDDYIADLKNGKMKVVKTAAVPEKKSTLPPKKKVPAAKSSPPPKPPAKPPVKRAAGPPPKPKSAAPAPVEAPVTEPASEAPAETSETVATE